MQHPLRWPGRITYRGILPEPVQDHIIMSDAESKLLAHAEYWDDRYANVGPERQVHEWFRSFRDLEPFLEQYLFQVRPPRTAPDILHLGSGDSVGQFARFVSP
jgi:hypothetical protein